MIELLKASCQCIWRVNNCFRLVLSISQSLSMCMNCAVFLLAVIEVASGEYGDLNPVLFEAVQGGLCSDESKKNSIDKNDPTTSCPSQCYNVSDEHTLTHKICQSLYQSLTRSSLVLLCVRPGFRLHWETHFCHQYLHTVLHPLQENLHHNMQGHGKNDPLLLLSVPNIWNVKEIQQ